MKKIKELDTMASGVSLSTLHGLVQLSDNEHFPHIGELIRLIKENVVFDEFAHPATDMTKNALHKEWCKGIDAGLTILAKTIRDAAIIADKMEEALEIKDTSKEKQDGEFAG